MIMMIMLEYGMMMSRKTANGDRDVDADDLRLKMRCENNSIDGITTS